MCAWFSWESWLTLNKWCWRSLRTGCRSCAGCCRTGWGGLQLPRNRRKTWWASCSLWPSVSSQAKSSRPGFWIFSAVAPELGECPIPDDLRADLRWWLTFLPYYNGVSVIPEIIWSDPDEMFACNACLTGTGVVSGPIFSHRIPSVYSSTWDTHWQTGNVDPDCGPEGLGEVPLRQEGHYAVRQPERCCGYSNWQSQGHMLACESWCFTGKVEVPNQSAAYQGRVRKIDSLICCPTGSWVPSTGRNYSPGPWAYS